MTDPIQMSVVIGFKNWGLRRLGLAIESVQNAFGSVRGEVIVSDYGSDEHAETERLAKSLGAIYIYTPTDGVWSRSRALNIGFAQSSGIVLACTDADMIFKPGSMERIYTAVVDDPNSTILLECRDLPQEWSDREISEVGPDWERFDRISKLRGRWGMGGMVAVTRDVFVKVRGLDERMHTYGCEDIDFGERTQRAGNKIVWLRDPGVRMFHMWHPPSGPAAEANPQELKIINANREILYNDKSYARNTTSWLYGTSQNHPLITVSIATRNRANFLPDAIHSVLSQTLQDFEIIIVDDGSTDNTEQVVGEFGDSRIRYYSQENRGIAAARNRAIEEARGRYVAVLDDDDIMLPWRLEAQIASIGAGQHGSYGSFVNFDNDTAELTMFHEKQVSVTTAFQKGGAPGHSTWMVETAFLRLVKYDESIVSGEDNNLFLRMLRSGARLSHCREVVVLRRMHSTQMTQTDNKVHERYAATNRYFFRFNTPVAETAKIEKIGNSVPWVSVREGKDFSNLVRPYLPDHLIQRTLIVNEVDVASEQLLDEIRETVDGLMDVSRYAEGGELMNRSLIVKSATHKTMADLRKLNVRFSVQHEDTPDTTDSAGVDLMENELARFVGEATTTNSGEASLAILVVHPMEVSSESFFGLGFKPTTNRISVGGESYLAHVVFTPSVNEAVEVTRKLAANNQISRLNVFTNEAAAKVTQYLSVPGGAL